MELLHISLIVFLAHTADCLRFEGSFTPDVLRGVVEILTDQHKIGGVYKEEYATSLECLQACRDSDVCLAVDYHAELQACWFHDSGTACTATVPEKGVKHIKLSSCITGVSVNGGTLMARYVTEQECVASCKRQVQCYGVDYNIKKQSCYHHFMSSVCTTKGPNPDTVHYSRVNCKSSPSAVQVSVGHRVLGGSTSQQAFTEGDCTTSCIHSADCVAVNYNYSNHTCEIHTKETACNPRFPAPGVTHFQFDQCPSGVTIVHNTFAGRVEYDDGTEVGTLMTLVDDLVGCLNLCRMTADCAAINWSAMNKTCLFLSTDNGCNSASPRDDFTHYEIVDCKVSGDVKAVHEKFHVLGGTEMPQYLTKDRCIDRCKQPMCQGVDWDEARQACYHHTKDTTCNTLVAKDECTHYSFAGCQTLVRSVVELRNTSRLPGELIRTMAPDGMTCIEECAAEAKCFSADFNPNSMECILHGLHDSCRDSVTVDGWFSYLFTDCDNVIPGAVNITGAHVPGATRLRMAVSGDACYGLCKEAPDCTAADFNAATSECYLHQEDTSCGGPIVKEGCTHYRLTDCIAEVQFTMPNARVAEAEGILQTGKKTEHACFHACKDDHYCAAFDFNSIIPECRLHYADTACLPTTDAISWTHHKLQQCHDLPTTPVTETAYDQIRTGGTMVSNSLSGPLACADKCLLKRITGLNCLGVDFDFTTNECFFHDNDDICDAGRIPFGDKVYEYPGYKRMMEGTGNSPFAQPSTKDECLAACHVQLPCQGVDYKTNADGTSGMCYFHYNSTACGVLTPEDDTVHYTFNDCSDNAAQVIAEVVYKGYTLPGGNSSMVGSELECVTTCIGSCFAVAYTEDKGVCVHYPVSDACGVREESQNTTLYLLTDCGHSLFTDHISAKYSGSRWDGGEEALEARTEMECLAVCVDNTVCTAFSFNRRKDTCFLHSDIGCAPVLQGEDVQDFTLYITTKANCDASNVFFAQLYDKFHMAGATLEGQFEQRECLERCRDSVLCYMVDYNPANMACWMHKISSCGNTLVPDQRIRHFSIAQCP